MIITHIFGQKLCQVTLVSFILCCVTWTTIIVSLVECDGHQSMTLSRYALKLELRRAATQIPHQKMSSRPSSSSSSSKGLTLDPRPQASHIHRLSGIAPPDTPPMKIRYSPPPLPEKSINSGGFRWFYATDVPKRKHIPDLNEKVKLPVKWSAFAARDSKALETAFQRTITNPDEDVPPVPVNEDHLFEVDIVARELKPVYFRGSTYEVQPRFR